MIVPDPDRAIADDPLLLGAEPLLLHAEVVERKDVLVRRGDAGDERLAESPRRVDDDLIGRGGQRVGGEHHARDLGGHHLLHDD